VSPSAIQLVQLGAAAAFIVGLKLMSHPRTARRGNAIAALGMLAAAVVTLLDREILSIGWILVAIVVGGAGGAVAALRVRMTGMPQMVALLNGSGGAASVLVATAELVHLKGADAVILIAIAASALIGCVTLSGSVVAWGKLEERGIFKRDWTVPGLLAINGVIFSVALAAALGLVLLGGPVWLLAVVVVVALVLGVTTTMPIGGADMPVVVALLNAYSGVAAAATGFVLGNPLLIVAGSLVGASGLILCRIMCTAMNRSLANVLFGGALSGQGTKASADEVYGGKVKSGSAEEVAMMFEGARRVVVVPGYGLAVAQAQHAVRDLYKTLAARGVEVVFAIHPVAGRMPGHMNVLLAEADIPYDRMHELEESNAAMERTDVVIVVGANDVVNPLARNDPTSAIAGMPIIDADKARACVVIKRSLSPGFAGLPNPLFAAPRTVMLFADAEAGLRAIIAAMKESG
jgi:NAD(P) transhydrogenase subunit beta